MTKVAAVLGAGIQGCCAALALSKLGFQVRLYDKSDALMHRASANQEGKIHLGFVYARDDSMGTARTMIEHALRFAPALESLIGTVLDWEPHLSTRFHCGIHRDSSLTKDELVAHFDLLQGIYEEVADDTRLHYLGRRPKRIWSMDTTWRFGGSSLVHVVQSEETAVHPGWMRGVIVAAVKQSPRITALLRHDVEHVEKVGQAFTISGVSAGETWRDTADVVVNCLWDGKPRVDRQLRHDEIRDWLMRVKYGFILEGGRPLGERPSLIILHGPFGDIVNYPCDNSTYISWYPACLAYIGRADRLPEAWEAACGGTHPPGLAERILEESIASLSEYVPQLRHMKLKQVMAGSILGRGTTDISDRESGLHRRHGIGVDASDHYYSIYTGKYTSGPANAIALQTMLA